MQHRSSAAFPAAIRQEQTGRRGRFSDGRLRLAGHVP